MVYIHPFMDGNGRAHRFLFHNVLAQREYAPPGTLFPLSAWLLNHRRDYIGCMTDTCQGILGTADLQRLPDGRLKVRNDIKAGFQFPDLTLEALSLCRFVEASVREELEPNIEFLKHFDEALHGLEVLVEWPYSRLVLVCTEQWQIVKAQAQPGFSVICPHLYWTNWRGACNPPTTCRRIRLDRTNPLWSRSPRRCRPTHGDSALSPVRGA